MITETPYAKAVLKLYEEIALSIKGHPIKTCITGGGCVHFLIGTRASSDVEGFFSSPIQTH